MIVWYENKRHSWARSMGLGMHRAPVLGSGGGDRLWPTLAAWPGCCGSHSCTPVCICSCWGSAGHAGAALHRRPRRCRRPCCCCCWCGGGASHPCKPGCCSTRRQHRDAARAPPPAPAAHRRARLHVLRWRKHVGAPTGRIRPRRLLRCRLPGVCRRPGVCGGGAARRGRGAVSR